MDAGKKRTQCDYRGTRKCLVIWGVVLILEVVVMDEGWGLFSVQFSVSHGL